MYNLNNVNNKALKQFLIDTNNAGYANGDREKWIKEPDNSTTITFKKGPWKAHDNFFGGEPYGGRIIVFYKNKPYWIMVYYGWIIKEFESNLVYGVLRNALMEMPEDAPFRGPNEYKQNEFTYSNTWNGEVEKFSGMEQITQGKNLIYKANYMGGLVNQRTGV